VLGVGTRIYSSADLDSLSNGVYGWNTNGETPTHSPFTGGGTVLQYGDWVKTQICQSYGGATYSRNKQGSGDWTSWVRCDNYGTSTPADLASLLGANTIDYGNKTDADIDALRTQGKYRIYAYQGTYWPVNTYGVLYVEVANNYTIQYFIKMAEGITYKRTMVTNAPTPTWSDWIMDYSTDILTRPTYLAQLASALGGDNLITGYLKRRGPVPNFDFNQAIDYGLYYITNENNWVNGPTGITKDQALLLSYGWNVNSRSVQVLFVTGVGMQSFGNNGVYLRVYRAGLNSEWTDWVKA